MRHRSARFEQSERVADICVKAHRAGLAAKKLGIRKTPYRIFFGKANFVREGDDVTMVALSRMALPLTIPRIR